MSSLVFLLTRSAKNTLLELMRKPAKLVLWVLLIAALGGIILLSLFTRQTAESLTDIVWLKGLLLALIIVFIVVAVQKGLSNGNAIFDMNDVNLLFVSPVSSRLVLMYGIVRMARMAFWAGFFILFQSNSLGRSFGVGFDAILLLLLGFILTVSVLQILSLLIYSLTNGRPARKLAVRLIAVAAFSPLITCLALQLAGAGAPLPALENTLRSPIAAWTPVAGWAAEGAVALIMGEVGSGLLFWGLIVLTGALLSLYIALSNPDYYEDVLVAAETAFEKKRDMSKGHVNAEASSTKKVKVSKTGIGGIGARAIFYKHLRESFRANRLGLWGLTSISTVLGAVLFSLFLRGGDGGILIILQTLMWLQIFMIGTGRGLQELYTHYIYLIPENSFRKIVWSNLEIAFRVLVESLAVFWIAGLIIGEPFLLIIAAVVVYTLFSFLLLGINYLSLRWTGADISTGFMLFIYTIAVVLVMLPGLVAAFFIGGMSGESGVLIGLGILALWELVAAMGCFGLSKGILHYCDMPVMKTGRQ